MSTAVHVVTQHASVQQAGSTAVTTSLESQQQQQQQTVDQPSTSTLSAVTGIAEHLVLRLVPKKKKKSSKGVRWAEDVVDNEFLDKKKSKKCCIFHKARQFGEWSDDDDSEDQCDAGVDGGDDDIPAVPTHPMQPQ